MDLTDIAIKGPLDTARTNIEKAFAKYEFRTEWYSQLEGRARRGKLGLNFAFGNVISPYCEIDIHLLTQTDGSIILRLIRSRVGMKGGIQSILADREFSEAVAGIANYFAFHV